MESDQNETRNHSIADIKIAAFVFVHMIFLLGVTAAAYIFRFTNLIPYNSKNWPVDCVLKNESFVTNKNLFGDRGTPLLSFNLELSPLLVYLISICTPIVVMVIGEMAVWLLTANRYSIFITVRRLVHFLCVFITGVMLTSLLVDLTKYLVARPRPNSGPVLCFYMLGCLPPDPTNCSDGPSDDQKREAKLSFPSYFSAISAYAAVFIMIYVQAIISLKSYIRPIILFISLLFPVLTGISRWITNQNHSEDIIAGYIIGICFALYMTVNILERFGFSVTRPTTGSRLQTPSSEPQDVKEDLLRNYSFLRNILQIPRIRLETEPVYNSNLSITPQTGNGVGDMEFAERRPGGTAPEPGKMLSFKPMRAELHRGPLEGIYDDVKIKNDSSYY